MEWTKFRSVPGWIRGSAVAALMIVVFPVTGMGGGPPEGATAPAAGPGGVPVNASHHSELRALTGDGSLTTRVSSILSSRPEAGATAVPWAKAGLILEAGGHYAAVMLTGGHGARMQHDYVHDRGSPAGGRWLRLTRAGDTVTGEVSADGRTWTVVDEVRLPGLPETVGAGLFVACPPRVSGLGTADDAATAEFGEPVLSGAWAGSWGELTLTGRGDLGPAARADVAVGATVANLLLGTFPALIVVAVIATLMITTEFRHGLIRTTLSAGAGRVRVLVAKALVLFVVTFAVSFVATGIAVPVWSRVVRGLGLFVFPASPGVLLRVVAGTAAVLATTAVLALAVGAVLRRGAPAVTAVVGAVVLPYLVALVPFTPGWAARWLTTWTPAAAWAVQQTVTRYPHVDSVYTPANDYFPVSPLAGFGVLGGYTCVVFVTAAVLVRRRDA